jgi:hypothetical protein
MRGSFTWPERRSHWIGVLRTESPGSKCACRRITELIAKSYAFTGVLSQNSLWRSFPQSDFVGARLKKL